MTKHTPGPWYLREIRGFDGIIRTVDGDPVASVGLSVGLSGCSEQTARANARLVAAAPDMLKALQQVAALYNPDLDPPRDIGLRMELMEELHAEVVGIIREAAGE